MMNTKTKTILSAAVIAAFVVTAPCDANAQGYPTFNIAKCVGSVTNIIGKVKNLMEFPKQVKKIYDMKDQVGNLEDIKGMVSGAIGSGKGAARDIQAVQTESEATAAAAEGVGPGRQYFVDMFYAEEDDSARPEVRADYKERRIQYLNKVVQDAYAASLFLQAKTVSEEYTDKTKALEEELAGTDTGGGGGGEEESGSSVAVINLNAKVTAAAIDAFMPLVTLELQKLQLEAAVAIKEDKGFSNYLLAGE